MPELFVKIKESTKQALDDLHLVYPELTLEELVNHLVQVTWCHYLDRLEAVKALTHNQVVGG